jgi:hypothetical protein
MQIFSRTFYNSYLDIVKSRCFLLVHLGMIIVKSKMQLLNITMFKEVRPREQGQLLITLKNNYSHLLILLQLLK